MKFSQIISKLSNSYQNHSLTLNRDCDPVITGVAAVDQALPGMIAYIEGKKFASWVEKTQASALIIPPDKSLEAIATSRQICWLSIYSINPFALNQEFTPQLSLIPR